MSDGGLDGSELGAAVVKHRSEEERDEEEDEQGGHVEDDRSEGDDGESEESRDLLGAGRGEPEAREVVRSTSMRTAEKKGIDTYDLTKR
jgi:hypothetical protein